MIERRFPNESQAYRDARAALLKDEQELVDKVKAVAEKRRKLPLGGKLKEDYVFRRANAGKVGAPVKFSELFGDHDTLLLYSFMFGPGWDKPCPSCTSLVDGFDRAWYSVTRECRVRGHRQGAGRTDRRVGQGAGMVADRSGVGVRVAVPGRLSLPRRQ